MRVEWEGERDRIREGKGELLDYLEKSKDWERIRDRDRDQAI